VNKLSYGWLEYNIPKELLDKLTVEELWKYGYCPRCKVKLTLTEDEPPFRTCPKCGAIG